jgi:Fe-S-cluster containining protein
MPMFGYGAFMEPLSKCIRCGTCCKKGGPALHLQDQPLIKNGSIPLICLSTIRQGEPAYDNVKKRLSVSLEDVVKIKNRHGSASCIFYEEKTSCCRIYANRPVECSTLNCWDTQGLYTLYEQNRISRHDIIGDIPGLRDLVADHQDRCDYEEVLNFVNNLKSSGKNDRAQEERVIYTLQYDLEIRKLVIEKTDINPEMIYFLFGRPMVDVLDALGMNMQRRNGKIVFSTTPSLLLNPQES